MCLAACGSSTPRSTPTEAPHVAAGVNTEANPVEHTAEANTVEHTAEASTEANTVEHTVEVPATETSCTFGASRDVARIDDPRLTEISGMVVSHRTPGVLFMHNDSGESVARYFAVRTDGTTLAEVIVDGAPSFDLEDAALEVQGGREWMWLGDIGDNAARDVTLRGMRPRESIDVIRSEVPTLPDAPAREPLHVREHEVFRFTFPDAPHDCEALLVDPSSGDLYFISKENEGPHRVYRAAAPHEAGSARVLEFVVEILPGRSLADAITAADIDPRGRIAVRTYRRTYLFSEGSTPQLRFSSTPLALPVIREFQGESIAFAPDGHTLYSIAEGEGETLHALDETCE